MADHSAFDVIIIGASAAGVAAAEALRKKNNTLSILLINKEPTVGYYRPMLGDYLSGTHKPHLFFLHPEPWYSEQNIILRLNTTVTSIENLSQHIHLDTGEILKYNKLILATGSSAFLPPIDGADKKGVFTLKTLADADQIKAWAANAKQAVVIGGGLLGLETAHELLHSGLKVTVIERESRLLPLQLDAQGAEVLERAASENGIQFFKNSVVHSIHGDQAITDIQLSTGENIPCDLAILSTGVRANLELAKSANLETARGVVVNEHMETSDPNILAAGDVVEFNNNYTALWTYALDQGRIAASTVLGENTPYVPAAPATIFNGFNLQVFSIGEIQTSYKHGFYTLMDWTADQNRYRRLNSISGTFSGGILINDMKKTAKLVRGIARKAPMQEMIADVLEL